MKFKISIPVFFGSSGGVPPKTRFVRFVKNKISIFKNETHSGGAGVRRPSGGAPPLRGCTAPHGVSDDDCSGLTQAGYGFRGAPPLEGCAAPQGVRHPLRGAPPLKGCATPHGVRRPSRGAPPLEGGAPPLEGDAPPLKGCATPEFNSPYSVRRCVVGFQRSEINNPYSVRC